MNSCCCLLHSPRSACGSRLWSAPLIVEPFQAAFDRLTGRGRSLRIARAQIALREMSLQGVVNTRSLSGEGRLLTSSIFRMPQIHVFDLSVS